MRTGEVGDGTGTDGEDGKVRKGEDRDRRGVARTERDEWTAAATGEAAAEGPAGQRRRQNANSVTRQYEFYVNSVI